MVISGRAGEEDVFKALELGAVDFIAKPTLRATRSSSSIEQELLRKVHAIRELRIDKVRERLTSLPSVVSGSVAAGASAPRVVVIGSSTGGPAALMQIFGAFPEPPRLRVPGGPAHARGLHRRLRRAARPADAVPRARGAGGEPSSRRARILVAPGGHHLELESVRGRVVTRIAPSRPGDKYVPSVDRLFESAAKHFGADLLAVVLTGMGDDGRKGVSVVKACGGSVIAESESTAVIFGMPQQAIRTGAVDAVLPLGEIATAIQRGVRRAKVREASRKGSV